MYMKSHWKIPAVRTRQELLTQRRTARQDLALASKANGGAEYEIECSADYVKTALVFISLFVLML